MSNFLQASKIRVRLILTPFGLAAWGVWEILVSVIFDFSVPIFLNLITPSSDLIQKNCLYTELDMTLDNECVGVICLKDIPVGGYSMWRNRDLMICKLVKSL